MKVDRRSWAKSLGRIDIPFVVIMYFRNRSTQRMKLIIEIGKTKYTFMLLLFDWKYHSDIFLVVLILIRVSHLWKKWKLYQIYRSILSFNLYYINEKQLKISIVGQKYQGQSLYFQEEEQESRSHQRILRI